MSILLLQPFDTLQSSVPLLPVIALPLMLVVLVYLASEAPCLVFVAPALAASLIVCSVASFDASVLG